MGEGDPYILPAQTRKPGRPKRHLQVDTQHAQASGSEKGEAATIADRGWTAGGVTTQVSIAVSIPSNVATALRIAGLPLDSRQEQTETSPHNTDVAQRGMMHMAELTPAVGEEIDVEMPVPSYFAPSSTAIEDAENK
eukprot:3836479-Rhodomonas_salina.1